jgi:tetratricopeptide (TPR) repeat protein
MSFDLGYEALEQGRYGDAVRLFEALADEGKTDAALSYNRGLAYAGKLSLVQTESGDFGQAIAAFEEARALSDSSALRDSATEMMKRLVERQSRLNASATKTQHASTSAELQTRERASDHLLRLDDAALSAVFLLSVISLVVLALWSRFATAVRPRLRSACFGIAMVSGALTLAVLLYVKFDASLGERAIALRAISKGGVSVLEGERIRIRANLGTQSRIVVDSEEITVDANTVRALAKP